MSKFLIFVILFTLLNLLLIPLISLYGLSVCPILHAGGFVLGCVYSSFFVVTSLLINFVMVFTQKLRIKRNSLGSFSFILTYILAVFMSVLVQQLLFKTNHFDSNSRAPEVLIIASLMLSITQFFGLSWATPQYKNNQNSQSISFLKSWLYHALQNVGPIAIAILTLLHFLLRQSSYLNADQVRVPIHTDVLISNTTVLVGFLVLWLSITYFFYYSAEREEVLKINSQLLKLEKLDFSDSEKQTLSWGLWLQIELQIKSFKKALYERSRLLKSFSQFVTKDVAERALSTDLKQYVGQSVVMTVMMIDIRNFTKISERLPPEKVVELLNLYFSQMLDVLTNHSIFVDKFIGDGILAYVENSSNEMVENRKAVLAAISMLKALENLNYSLLQKKMPEISIGIGIYRGPLVVGLIGSEEKLQHTIIGDTVNRAGRLEGLNKDLNSEVVLSAELWKMLPDDLKTYFTHAGKQTIKGISEPVEVYCKKSLFY